MFGEREFIRNVLAAERAALPRTLLEPRCALRCGVEPRAYLREATLRAVRNPRTVTLARDLKSPAA